MCDRRPMQVKVKPSNDWVLIKRNESRDVTAGGIVIPDAAKQKALTGRVLDVGPGLRLSNGERSPLDVKRGDTVSFPHFHGEPVQIDGDDYLMIREGEIFGIIDEV